MPTPKMATREVALKFPATIAGMAAGSDALRAFLDGIEIGATRRYQLELTFDEIASNIIRHGQPVSVVELVVAVDHAEAVMTFDDDGVPFDPRSHKDTRQPGPIEHAQIGGLGLVLVKSSATRIEYERTHQHHNRLTLAIPLG
jgi:anti-sigma regulatory factor (Ser/Thr protein kinase)